MTNPFKNNDKAFEVFFDEPVVIRLKTGEEQTIFCSVFQDVEGDPLSEGSIESERKDISINCRKKDWVFVQKIKRGDTVERPEIGMKYKVQTVENDFALGIIIKARQS